MCDDYYIIFSKHYSLLVITYFRMFVVCNGINGDLSYIRDLLHNNNTGNDLVFFKVN